MKQAGTDIIRYLAKMFRTVPDPRITDAINLRNIKNIYVFSSIACIFDTFSLVLFAMTKQDSPRFRQVFFNVSCCIFACIIVILLSRAMLRKYKKDEVLKRLSDIQKLKEKKLSIKEISEHFKK